MEERERETHKWKSGKERDIDVRFEIWNVKMKNWYHVIENGER